MGQAVLNYSGGIGDIKVINGMLDAYKAYSEDISVNSFVDFINTTQINTSDNTTIANQDHAGLINQIIYEDGRNQFFNSETGTHEYWVNNYFPGIEVFPLADNRILLVWTWSMNYGSYATSAVIIKIQNGSITVGTPVLLTYRGNGRKILKITDSLFIAITGSWRDNTNGSYPIGAQAITIQDMRIVLGTAVSSGRYYYCVLVNAFVTGPNSAIVFWCDGNGNGYRYHYKANLTWSDAGVITWSSLSIDPAASSQEAQYLYEVFQINEKLYVECCHYDKPWIWTVKVSDDGTTSTRSATVQAAATTNYTNYAYVHQPFQIGSKIYYPYYSGTAWTMECFDCSLENSDRPVSLTTTIFGPMNDATKPIIFYRPEENLFLCFQRNGLTYMGMVINVDPNTGLPTPNVRSYIQNIGVNFDYIPKIFLCEPGCGFMIGRQQYSNTTYGVIPFQYDNTHIWFSGTAETWEDNFAYSTDYAFIRQLNDNYTLFVFQRDDGDRKAKCCFTIYSKKLVKIDPDTGNETEEFLVKRSNIETMFRNDYWNGTESHFLDYKKVNDHCAIVMYRDRSKAHTSYSALFISTIIFQGTKCYVKTEKIRDYQDSSNAGTYDRGRLIQINEHEYIAMYRGRNSDAWCEGTYFSIQPELKVISPEVTGQIAGFTTSNCTTDTAGMAFMLDIDGAL